MIYFYEEYLYSSSVISMLITFILVLGLLWISDNLYFKLFLYVFSLFKIWATLHFAGLPLSYLSESVFLPLDTSYKYWDTLSSGLGGAAACVVYFVAYLTVDIAKCIKYIRDNL